MNKKLQIFITILISVLVVSSIVYAASTFPTSLNNWIDGDVIESDWGNGLEAKIGIDNSAVVTSLDYLLRNAASTDPGHLHTIYLQLTGGTMTGNLLGTSASMSANFEVSGYSSSSATFGSGLTDCDAANQTLNWDASTGLFSCGTDASGGGGGTAVGVSNDGGSSFTNVTSMSFDANQFDVAFPDEAFFTLDWTNGPASKALENTWTAFNLFSDDASVSGDFEVVGNVQLGINSSGDLLSDDVDLMIGGTNGGILSFGGVASAQIGLSSDGIVAGIDYDKAMIFRNRNMADSGIPFIFVNGNNEIRFAIPEARVDRGTWNSRSLIVAGPFTSNASITNCSFWGATNIDCATDITGADFFVQDDIEVLDNIYVEDVIASSSIQSVTASVSTNFEVSGTASVSALTIGGFSTSGTNTGDVTLAGTPNYITISNQVITRAKLDISDDTNATGGVGVDITANDFTFDATEIDAVTWSDGANSSNAHTYDVSGTDPIFTAQDGGFAITGTSSVSSHFEVTGDIIHMGMIGAPASRSLKEWIGNMTSAGRISGGDIANLGVPDVSVAAGTGWIKATDDDLGEPMYFEWTASSSITIPSDTTQWIGIDYNAGSPEVVVKATDDWNRDSDFPLGSVIHDGTDLHVSNNPAWTSDQVTNVLERFYDTAYIDRDAKGGGLGLGESADNNMDVTLTAGKLWSRLNEFEISAIDTSAAGTFILYYRGGGGWVREIRTEWNNESWDNAGTIASLSANRYSNQYFYIDLEGELLSVLGQAEYTALATAEAEGVPSAVPDAVSEHALIVGRIIRQDNQTIATSVESAFTVSFAGAAVQNHGDLSGLTDDDHTQYILEDGSRDFSGNQAFAGFDITGVGNFGGATGSISNNFEIDGYASASALFGSMFPDGDCDDPVASKLLWDSTTGQFQCGSDQNTGGGGGTAIGVSFDDEGTFDNVTSISYNPNSFSGTVVGALLNLDLNWGADGPASKAAENTWAALNIFSLGASSSTNFEATGYASASQFFGPLTGDVTGDLTGTADLADALTSNPTDCSDNTEYAYQIAANGNLTCQAITGSDGVTFSAGDWSIDWGLVPSASAAVTLTGNWVNTTNPWADNEVSDNLTIDTGSTLNTLSIGSGKTWTTTGQLTIGDGGDAIVFDTSNWDVDSAGIFSGLTGLTTTGQTSLANASVSGDFETIGLASASKYFGATLADCDNATTSKLLWSDTGLFSCGTDQTGAGAFSGIDFGTIGGSAVKVTSTSYSDAHFTLSNTASEGFVTLDWGAGGPASLSENETIAGNWVNTTNPWADNEVDPALTITSGTINAISIGSAVTWTTTGTLTIGDGGDRVDFSTDTWDMANGVLTGSTISTNNVTGTWTTTGNLTIGDGGDDIIINSDTWDVSSAGVMSGVTGFTSTGVIDLGGATSFELPNGASPTVDAEGEIAVDTGGFGQLVVYASGQAQVLTGETTVAVAFGSTSFDTWSSKSLGYMFRGMTVQRITCKAVGGTSIVLNLSRDGTTDMDSITCATSDTFDDGTIANSTVSKGETLILEKGTVTGEVDQVTFTFTKTQTRE